MEWNGKDSNKEASNDRNKSIRNVDLWWTGWCFSFGKEEHRHEFRAFKNHHDGNRYETTATMVICTALAFSKALYACAASNGRTLASQGKARKYTLDI
jgi:hypothetical protein